MSHTDAQKRLQGVHELVQGLRHNNTLQKLDLENKVLSVRSTECNHTIHTGTGHSKACL